MGEQALRRCSVFLAMNYQPVVRLAITRADFSPKQIQISDRVISTHFPFCSVKSGCSHFDPKQSLCNHTRLMVIFFAKEDITGDELDDLMISD